MSGGGGREGVASGSSSQDRFRPAARASVRDVHRLRLPIENIRMELVSIEARTALVASTQRSEFRDGTAAYDAASMAMIRLAALLERQEMTETAGAALSPDELAAIRTTRNIAAHAGYRNMNDDLLWLAVTERVPDILERLLSALPRA